MNKIYLIQENGCWADEFDLEGFKIVEAPSEEEAFEEVISERIGNRKFPIEIYFGTNESQEYETKEELLNDLSIQEITKEDYEVLTRIFPNCTRSAIGVTAIL